MTYFPRSFMWTLFACIYAFSNTPKDAATRADTLLDEYDKRFNASKPGS